MLYHSSSITFEWTSELAYSFTYSLTFEGTAVPIHVLIQVRLNLLVYCHITDLFLCQLGSSQSGQRTGSHAHGREASQGAETQAEWRAAQIAGEHDERVHQEQE